MLFAVKKNREIKIEEEEKGEFFDNGFDIVEIVNDKANLIMSHSNNETKIAELKKANAELKKELDKSAKANKQDESDLNKEEREELKSKAKTLGLNIAHNISDEKLKERIEEAEKGDE